MRRNDEAEMMEETLLSHLRTTEHYRYDIVEIYEVSAATPTCAARNVLSFIVNPVF